VDTEAKWGSQIESGLKSNRLWTDRWRVRLRLILPVWTNSRWIRFGVWTDVRAEFQIRLTGWIRAEIMLAFFLHHHNPMQHQNWDSCWISNRPTRQTITLNLSWLGHLELSEIGSSPCLIKKQHELQARSYGLKQHDVGSIWPDCNNRKLTGLKTGWEHGVANSTIKNSINDKLIF